MKSPYQGIRGRILRKYDMWVYFRACKSINRMCKHNPGFAYLMELSIHDWLAENPIPESLKSSTEHFHQEFTSHKP